MWCFLCPVTTAPSIETPLVSTSTFGPGEARRPDDLVDQESPNASGRECITKLSFRVQPGISEPGIDTRTSELLPISAGQ